MLRVVGLLWLMTALGVAVGCGEGAVVDGGSDQETIQLNGKFDEANRRPIAISAGDELALDLTGTGAISIKFIASESNDERLVELIVAFEEFEFRSAIAPNASLLVHPGRSRASEGLTYSLTLVNHSDDDVDGYLEAIANADTGACKSTVGMRTTDPVQFIAQCTNVVEPARDNDPPFEIRAIDGCLLRGVSGWTDTPYVLFTGEIEIYNIEHEYDLTDTIRTHVFFGEKDNSHALEDDHLLDVREYQKGNFLVDREHFLQEFIYDPKLSVMNYQSSTKDSGFWKSWEPLYSAQFECTAL